MLITGALLLAACSGTTTSTSNSSSSSTAANQEYQTPTLSAGNQEKPTDGRSPGSGGTIESINGDTLTISTNQNEQITVTIDSNTTVQKTVTGSTADLAIGDSVMIAGTTDSSGNITATEISIRPQGQNAPQAPADGTMPTDSMPTGSTPTGSVPSGTPPTGQGQPQGKQDDGTMGTIASIGGDTLTVTTMEGTVKVTINSDTTVQKTIAGTTADLATGQSVNVRGSQDSNGNITADSIEISII